MPANLRIGGVRVDFSANASSYHAVASSVQTANARLAGSYRTVGRSAGRQSKLVTQFTNSLQSSLIATIAYAAGVRALISVTSGTIQTSLEWEESLVKIQKTTGLTSEETAKLGDNFERLLTVTSALNRPLPVTSRELLEIAEVAGQMNIRGVPNITRFTEVVALMGLTTDLAGADAANALGLIITNTDAVVEDVGRIGAVITVLGNNFRGGERDILSIAESLARSTSEFNLSARAILAYSAVLAQAGSSEQKAGTVFQRTLRVLNTAANEALSGQPERLQAIANATDNAEESYSRLIETIHSGDLGGALGILLEALQNLQSIGTGQTRGGLLTLLFGGDQGPPIRPAEVIGVLTKSLPEVTRAIADTNREWEQQVAQLEEAGLFAEARSKRLQIVQNQLELQGKAVGDALSAVYVPLAEHFKVLQAAIVGAGTALAFGFGRRRLRAASVFTGQLKIQAQISGVAARTAQQDALKLAAANSVSNSTGIRRLALAEQLATAELKAAAATRVHAANVAALSRANRIGARAQRAWTAALAFTGGYIGLAIAGLTALTTAVYLYWGSAKAAEEGSESLSELLTRLTNDANITAAGLSVSERALARTTTEIERLKEARRELLEGSLEDVSPRARPSIRIGRDREAAERQSEIEELESLADGLRTALEGVASTKTSDGLTGIASRFKDISLSLNDPTRQLRDFIEELDRATASATERARFDLALAPFSQFDQEVFTAAFERRAEIQGKALELEKALRDAETDQGRASALVDQAKARLELFDIGTDDYENAKRQLGQAVRQLEKSEELVESSGQNVAYGKEKLKLDIASLRVQIQAQNIARNAQALAAPLNLDPPDLRGQASAAAAFLRQLELRVSTQEREALQLGKLAGLRQVDRAELAASFDILNQLADAKIRADEIIIKAEERVVRTRRELIEVNANLSGQRDDSGRILAAAQASAEAERALAEAKALREEFDLLGPAAIKASEAYANAAGRIAKLQIDSAGLLQVATDLAQSGVRGIEDSIIKLATQGGLSFKEFANSIIADLLRIIYRATITVALLRVLGVGAGGNLTGEGLLGRFAGNSGVLGSGGPAGFQLHEGGIAGATARRHQGPLRSNESLAVLERGEEVLTRGDPRHRYNFGSAP